MSGRPWTPDEVGFLRTHYMRMPAREIASRLRRSLKSIYMRAKDEGLSQTRCPRAGLEQFVREQYTAGRCDQEIAAAWSRRHSGYLPIERKTIGRIRQRLGLPLNRWNEYQRGRVRQKTQEQLRKAGLPSLAAVRADAFRRLARRCGWPDDLRPRAVMILNALWEHGPMTREQIAHTIGMAWRGSRMSMKSNDPEGSYLAHLLRRGLVVCLGRQVQRKGRGRSVNVYSLPLSIQRNTGA